MSNLKIGFIPITNSIFIGSVSKDGKYWLSNKTDITNDAICAVADHVLAFQREAGKSVIVRGDGGCDLKITVEVLSTKGGE